MLVKILLQVTSAFLLVVGAQATCTRPADLLSKLYITDEDVELAFSGLDVDGDDEITSSDLEHLFYHSDAEFARSKFLDLIKPPADSQEGDIRELKRFMETKAVTLAIYECKFMKSTTLRKYCFADQILFYVYLVLDQYTISTFYGNFKVATSQRTSDGICLEDLMRLTALSDKFEENDALILLHELAGERRRILSQEFARYVMQRDILDDFRVCRQAVENLKPIYYNNCLILQLMRFTMNHMTELEIANLFNLFDEEGTRQIEAFHFFIHFQCDPTVAKRFIDVMDVNKDNWISYAEFRHFVKLRTVKLHFERICSTVVDREARLLECYKDELQVMAKEHHTPTSIWLWLPSLDKLFIFEELNVNNDGLIKLDEDLINGLGWDASVAFKLIYEMSPDEEKDINLEELLEYMDQPNIVYALARCLNETKGPTRMACYLYQLTEMLERMMALEVVADFFAFYDKDGDDFITDKELGEIDLLGIPTATVMAELGMGDYLITKREFTWYVRQREIASMLLAAQTADPAKLHLVLLDYLRSKMTEYDVQELFKKLDKDGNYEITRSDLMDTPEFNSHLFDMVELTEQKDKIINFNEFWLYVNTPFDSPRKKELEEACIKPGVTQEAEMTCFFGMIWNMK